MYNKDMYCMHSIVGLTPIAYHNVAQAKGLSGSALDHYQRKSLYLTVLTLYTSSDTSVHPMTRV